ncbi:1-phosphofructokinase [Aliivibrio sifiae]|uniref:Phosphofructokinase n=1 Tax=Aliivibrio sifiae TaxID=566293 RepID=A0A2S7X6N3_9GAMM|nr:1-phosphofructokinase [Aliivibrio sifiae]PQJ86979.1 1-phosphofructokinase [Aliivibrio sifiae]GLR73892.1 phosphofructokinase [Aliivibrio sifiae]
MSINPKSKVVTITLNPALDLTGSLDALSVGSVSLVSKGSLHAAGKGVNVAKVLSDLGAKVTVTGFLGRDNEELFCQLFEEMNANDEFIRVDGATRINVKLVETDGRVSDINFPGVEVSQQAIAEFEVRLFELAKTHEFFVLAGSLPKGISPEQCAEWIEKLHQMGKKVLFDSSRAALAAGLDAHPWLIKPNDEELSEFVGRELDTPEACQQAAQDLAQKGIENIVVSLGSKGVMWLGKKEQAQPEWMYSQPPKMNVVSTVGAGDTLVAGLCWGHMQQDWDRSQILSFATALSALAVSQVGVGVPNVEDVKELQKQVTLHNPISTNVQ